MRLCDAVFGSARSSIGDFQQLSAVTKAFVRRSATSRATSTMRSAMTRIVSLYEKTRTPQLIRRLLKFLSSVKIPVSEHPEYCQAYRSEADVPYLVIDARYDAILGQSLSSHAALQTIRALDKISLEDRR